MPGRYSTRRRGMAPIITSIKNQGNFAAALAPTVTTTVLAKAVNTPVPTVATDVSHGCLIKAIWLTIDACGLGGTGVLNNMTAYIFKNPGDNLTEPAPQSVGTSNEKKFVIKMWRAMIMRNQDGNVPYHWEGWIKIPKRYQRMGTDDVWTFNINCTSALTGHFAGMFIYKWYR